MLHVTLLVALASSLNYQSSPTFPAQVVQVEEGKLTVRYREKNIVLLISAQVRVLDPEGKELSFTKLQEVVKAGEGVSVTTARARADDFPNVDLKAFPKMVTVVRLAQKGPTGRPPRTRATPGEAGTIKDAEVVKVERGRLTVIVDDMELTAALSVRLKAYDAEGKEPKLPAQVMVPGNRVDLKTTRPDPAEVKAGRFSARDLIITEIRLVRGKLGDLTPNKTVNSESGSAKIPGGLVTANLTRDEWESYYRHAKVGDFIEYHGRDRDEPPSRKEIMEVSPQHVVVKSTSYYFKAKDETWRKLVYDEQKAQAAAKAPRPPRDRGATRRSETTLTLNGSELPCILTESGDQKNPSERKWTSRAVPFDGLVRHELRGKDVYTLLNFRKGQ